MDNYTLTIKINDGHLFEGSLDQVEDCFFSFPPNSSVNEKLNLIQNYCSDYNYNLTFSWKAKDKNNNSKLLVQVK